MDTATFLAMTFFGNTVRDYITSGIILVASFAVLAIFKKILVGHMKKLAEKTVTDFDDFLVTVVEKIGWPFYVTLSIYLATRTITIASYLEHALHYLILIIVTYYIAKAAGQLIVYAMGKVAEHRSRRIENYDSGPISVLAKIIKAVIWLMAILLVLSNLGYDVSTLIAGLGVGGIAVGFALQNILADIFASFSIYFDKPFKVGDFIVTGNDMGVVKKIGIKSTRLQTLQGQELIISNKELTETRVNNYKKMEKRRVVFTIGVTYGTSLAKLKKAIAIIRKAIEDAKLATFDRSNFKAFGDFSLQIETVFYVDTSDYNKYMDIQQEILFAIKERFAKERIEMAFPTQTIHVEK